ncbi:MAG: thioredoxin family protein [Oscillospiraceae bacterium]
MKDILYFHLKDCPHCRRANSFLQELLAENPEYKKVAITAFEEKQNAEIAAKYDYYLVPCFYVGGKKMHEGAITKSELKAVMDSAIAE